ncbi:MAG: cell wall-active antibiotics response protein [Prevotellaceae bacterium]|jgi:predicted membrane protein|nr:cell wall-active antibiotics response protein [Prevotellaceae bacterium]
MEENKNGRIPRGQYIFGIILILLGMLLLLSNFGFFEKSMQSIIFSFQMLCIVCAILLFLYRHFFFGAVVFILGLFFLVPKLVDVYPDTFGWLGDNFTATYWPALLIIFGIWVIVRLFLPKSKRTGHCKIFIDSSIHGYKHKRKKCNCGCDNCNCNFDKNAIFGSLEEIILDPVFKGGEMNSVFGSIILDLRKTTLPEGDTELEVNSVFGSATLFIPDNWNIELHVSSFASGFSDNRNISSEIDYSRKLIITGGFAFAGGEIRS